MFRQLFQVYENVSDGGESVFQKRFDMNVINKSNSAGTNAKPYSHESGVATSKKGEKSNSAGTNAKPYSHESGSATSKKNDIKISRVWY